MLNTFLDKMSGFFDQRFVVAYLIPVLIGLLLALGIAGILIGPAMVAAFGWLATRSGTELALLGAGILLVIFLLVYLLAYLLATLTTPIVRLYEGYWPEWWITHKVRNLQERFLANQQKALTIREEALADQQKALTLRKEALLPDQQQSLIKWEEALADQQKALAAKQVYAAATRYLNFPRNSKLLKPTRLGNVLAAAEEYSFQLYWLDAVIWWPRLAPLLPDDFRVQVDTALTPMLMMLNLSLTFTLIDLMGAGIVILFHWHWLLFATILIVGLLLAWACYMAAISQAVDYGNWIRVAFDLYRHEPLKKMHIPIPDNLLEERRLWASLNEWLYKYTPPWEVAMTTKAPSLERPFYYDMHKTTPSPVQLQEVAITLKGVTQSELQLLAQDAENSNSNVSP